MSRKIFVALAFAFTFLLPVSSVHADTQPIYGIWFYQQTDDVHIVYFNHQTVDVTDEFFGTSYTDAATQGCLNYVQTLYLVRYRQDVGSTWSVWCYTDPNNYVSIPGSEFGQNIIDAAVARAQHIVYSCLVPPCP